MRGRSARSHRPAVSYREDDFEEDEDDENFSNSDLEEEEVEPIARLQPGSRSRMHDRAGPGASTTRSSTQFRPRQDTQSQSRQDIRSQPRLSSRSQPRRNSQQHLRDHPQVSYREESTDEDGESDATDQLQSQDPDVTPVGRNATPRQARGGARGGRPTRSLPWKRANRPQKRTPVTRPGLGAPRRPATSAPVVVKPIISDGRIPDWASLPYEILRSIFKSAAGPLLDDTGMALAVGVPWLIATARVCQAFKEPALHTLFQSPPIDCVARGNSITNLLELSRLGQTGFTYHTKPRAIHLETTMFGSSPTSAGWQMLQQLLPTVPLLQHLIIWNRFDDSVVHNRTSLRCVYPREIGDWIKAAGIRLKSWQWHGDCLHRELEHDVGINRFMLKESNIMMPFQASFAESLTGLTFSQLGAYWSHIRVEEGAYEKFPHNLVTEHRLVSEENELSPNIFRPNFPALALARSINTMKNLDELDFLGCSISTPFLQLITIPLVHLSLISCPYIESTGFRLYLEARGFHLEHLKLDHNQALNISFFPALGTACPHLKSLKMDFTYGSELLSLDDHSAAYDKLMDPHEEPTWPASLTGLELSRMRNWDAPRAETFFNSLIKAAPILTNLRRLIISASVDMSWRDRAKFRDMWTSKLERVFLRKSALPDPTLQSLKTFRIWKEHQQTHETVQISDDNLALETASSTMVTKSRFSHVAITPKKRKAEDEPRKLRSRDPKPAPTSAPDAGGSGTGGLSLGEMVKSVLEEHIQGLCDTVDVRIDNLRPREHQLNEADFLDDELSGDEDWQAGREEDFGSEL